MLEDLANAIGDELALRHPSILGGVVDGEEGTANVGVQWRGCPDHVAIPGPAGEVLIEEAPLLVRGIGEGRDKLESRMRMAL